VHGVIFVIIDQGMSCLHHGISAATSTSPSNHINSSTLEAQQSSQMTSNISARHQQPCIQGGCAACTELETDMKVSSGYPLHCTRSPARHLPHQAEV
jgi:hypothetical protein